MKPAAFEFLRPTSLAQAVAALSGNPDAKVLAGGQSLIPLLSMRLAAPSLLVDINGIEELSWIRADEEGVRIGALARHAEVEAHPGVRRVQPLVSRALRLVAHPTIRNRGTTVGSLVHADPSAEMPAILLLLDGGVTAASTEGEREIAASDLFVGPLESSLRHGELATAAYFPALQPGQGVACDEVSRRQGDYALCGVAAVVGVDGSGQVTSARAAYWSVSDVPVVVDVSEAFAAGEMGDRALDDAVELALPRLDPADDIHGSAAYRTQLVRVLTRRVLRAAHDDATTPGKESAA